MKASTPSSLRLYLIRHGETEWSLSGRHTGRTDIQLTHNGESEARELGKRLRGIPFAYVLSSPLKRVLQTCELVGLDKVPEMETDLVEWDYGDYEGQCSADIHNKWPDWNIYRDGCPQGEMPEQISNRVDRLIARLRKLDGNTALFSHGSAQHRSVFFPSTPTALVCRLSYCGMRSLTKYSTQCPSIPLAAP